MNLTWYKYFSRQLIIYINFSEVEPAAVVIKIYNEWNISLYVPVFCYSFTNYCKCKLKIQYLPESLSKQIIQGKLLSIPCSQVSF